MKKHFLISVLILYTCITKLFAQTTRYDTCNKLQQYVGEWRYTNGADTIRIYLRYHKYFAEVITVNYLDGLWGWHEYKTGNTVIQSNYQNRFVTLPSNATDSFLQINSIALSMPDCSDTSHRLIGLIKDSNHPTSTYRIVATLDSTKTVMTWWQTFSRGSFHNPDTDMTLPQEFILYKQ